VPYIFFRPFRLFLAPTICPWVSEEDQPTAKHFKQVTLETFDQVVNKSMLKKEKVKSLS